MNDEGIRENWLSELWKSIRANFRLHPAAAAIGAGSVVALYLIPGRFYSVEVYERLRLYRFIPLLLPSASLCLFYSAMLRFSRPERRRVQPRSALAAACGIVALTVIVSTLGAPGRSLAWCSALAIILSVSGIYLSEFLFIHRTDWRRADSFADLIVAKIDAGELLKWVELHLDRKFSPTWEARFALWLNERLPRRFFGPFLPRADEIPGLKRLGLCSMTCLEIVRNCYQERKHVVLRRIESAVFAEDHGGADSGNEPAEKGYVAAGDALAGLLLLEWPLHRIAPRERCRLIADVRREMATIRLWLLRSGGPPTDPAGGHRFNEVNQWILGESRVGSTEQTSKVRKRTSFYINAAATTASLANSASAASSSNDSDQPATRSLGDAAAPAHAEATNAQADAYRNFLREILPIGYGKLYLTSDNRARTGGDEKGPNAAEKPAKEMPPEESIKLICRIMDRFEKLDHSAANERHDPMQICATTWLAWSTCLDPTLRFDVWMAMRARQRRTTMIADDPALDRDPATVCARLALAEIYAGWTDELGTTWSEGLSRRADHARRCVDHDRIRLLLTRGPSRNENPSSPGTTAGKGRDHL